MVVLDHPYNVAVDADDEGGEVPVCQKEVPRTAGTLHSGAGVERTFPRVGIFGTARLCFDDHGDMLPGRVLEVGGCNRFPREGDTDIGRRPRVRLHEIAKREEHVSSVRVVEIELVVFVEL